MQPLLLKCIYITKVILSEICVRIGELKNKMSKYMRRAKAGKTIIVTEHGKTICQIEPVKPSVGDKVLTMVAAGQAEWNGQRHITTYRAKVRNQSTQTLADLIVGDRE
jgi:prevent-host-death family protein